MKKEFQNLKVRKFLILFVSYFFLNFQPDEFKLVVFFTFISIPVKNFIKPYQTLLNFIMLKMLNIKTIKLVSNLRLKDRDKK